MIHFNLKKKFEQNFFFKIFSFGIKFSKKKKKNYFFVFKQQLSYFIFRTLHSVVSLLYEDESLYAGSIGKFFRIDPKNGSIICKNKLKGKGYNFMVKEINKEND